MSCSVVCYDFIYLFPLAAILAIRTSCSYTNKLVNVRFFKIHLCMKLWWHAETLIGLVKSNSLTADSFITGPWTNWVHCQKFMHHQYAYRGTTIVFVFCLWQQYKLLLIESTFENWNKAIWRFEWSSWPLWVGLVCTNLKFQAQQTKIFRES